MFYKSIHLNKHRTIIFMVILALISSCSILKNSYKTGDRDGVAERKDKCPDTPLGIVVDKNGCPLDIDGDGIPDYLDKCPDEPGLLKFDGCPDKIGRASCRERV